MKTVLKLILAAIMLTSLTACVIAPPYYDYPHYGWHHGEDRYDRHDDGWGRHW